MSEQKIVFGVCWFQREQWERLLEISEDRDDLEISYDEWRKSASKAIKDIQAQGNIVKKVKVNLEDLLAWCNAKHVPVNGSSRAEYVTHLLQEKNQKP